MQNSSNHAESFAARSGSDFLNLTVLLVLVLLAGALCGCAARVSGEVNRDGLRVDVEPLGPAETAPQPID